MLAGTVSGDQCNCMKQHSIIVTNVYKKVSRETLVSGKLVSGRGCRAAKAGGGGLPAPPKKAKLAKPPAPGYLETEQAPERVRRQETMTQFDAIAFGRDRNDVTRLYVTQRRDGKYKAQYVYSGGTRVNKVIDADKLKAEHESGKYRIIGSTGSLLTVQSTPTAQDQTATGYACNVCEDGYKAVDFAVCPNASCPFSDPNYMPAAQVVA